MKRLALAALLALAACSKPDPCPALRADLKTKSEAAKKCVRQAEYARVRAEDGIPPPDPMPDCAAMTTAAAAAQKAADLSACN
jgi:hypothetical protein